MNTDTITDQHPVLVYGTLRPGQGNYRYFLGGTTLSEANVRLTGFAMYSNGGFPYLVDGEGEVTATLIHIDPTRYAEVLHGLDGLEGYRPGDRHNHYERRLITINHEGAEVQAWIYIADASIAREISENLPRVHSGDWIDFDRRLAGYRRY